MGSAVRNCVDDGGGFAACGLGTGPASERSREVRLLSARTVLVAVLLRGSGRAQEREQERAAAMRRATLLVRGARVVAAVRKGLSGILPEPGAAARPQHRFLDARPDAGAAPDLPRMG